MYTDYLTEDDVFEVMQWMDARYPEGYRSSRDQYPRPAAGLIVREIGGTDIAALPVFFCGHVAFGGYCVGNPAKSGRKVYAALQMLFGVLPVYAASCGATHLSLWYANRGINRILGRIGYRRGDESSVNWIWRM